jgi:peroxiredoxin
MKKTLKPLLAVALAVGAGLGGYMLAEDDTPPPPVTLTSTKGKTLQTLLTTPMPAYKGQVVVINFWATWCPPCRKEMPDLVALQQKFKGQGVQVVGLSIDTAENVKAFQQQYQIPFPLLIAEPEVAQWSTELGNTAAGLPFTLVLDKNGEIRHAQLGQISAPALETLLTDLTRS